MSLTSRDIEEIGREPIKEPRCPGLIVSIVRLLLKIPPFRKYIADSVGGMTSFMDHHNWWRFMKHGVDSAKHINDKEVRVKLVEYANTGIEPYEGYDVAYSYLEFSRWKYEEDNYDAAIKFAAPRRNLWVDLRCWGCW